MSEPDLLKEGDYVIINGGGISRVAELKKNNVIRMGRSGAAHSLSLVGCRNGEVVFLNHGSKAFVATDQYPDLDLTDIESGKGPASPTEDPEEDLQSRDNRNLVDDNKSQQLTNEEVAAIRKEKGFDHFLSSLVEKSTTFDTKTAFSQEKYLRKKHKKYGTNFKIERVYIDNLAEIHYPTISPSDKEPDEAVQGTLRLRADAAALILHHSNIMHDSYVLTYSRTNSLLESFLLTRLGSEGRLFQILDRNGQPNTYVANNMMGLKEIKERWKAVPRNPGFLEGAEDPPPPEGKADAAPKAPKREYTGVTQWMKGLEAREMLMTRPADSLVIVDDEGPKSALADLFPFLAYGGHLVVYSPFLEDLTPLFLMLRNDCINVSISETWYRHHQVLSQRTHPTVNMSTAAGYILTGIKVPVNPNPRPRFAGLENMPSHVSGKRKRDKDDAGDTVEA
ncbi:tRNA (adenine-N(1)-)-methyltransferase non-catalytic subunit [Strigomonas culicis]|uniref:tRNA (adenine(58)-N(1))-methyltransferase non-catalytic subunit TRM6 n=1 Tax=Strigomonas culicis TaxID=28005 RepID=S9VDR3_9TRYP|nr:tRNA (adenine-N(1)-)-methyltransferase non-catalytic subunit [Strigomonas culicis]EPY27136.1 tRNA (adenine-N(1)-)-methyltransferase non-catalytic subunit [Strigomonas culicis]|eukprot:EPY21200.1 tRNA (adenine-N(1)-)-methyltransferase non-catalytic subunit [Strigomonas culicis]